MHSHCHMVMCVVDVLLEAHTLPLLLEATALEVTVHSDLEVLFCGQCVLASS